MKKLMAKHIDKSVRRHVFTKAERDAIYSTQKKQSMQG